MDNQASDNASIDDLELKVYSGRKYHDNEKIPYLLPQDSDETSRLNKQHVVLRNQLQSNFVAPLQKQLEEGITVLDSACGPASWALEMANDYPNSKFYGVDITNTFPSGPKPDNCEFVIGNIAEEIPFPDNTFDYIHQRLVFLALTSEMYESNMKELYRVLKPGGCLELREPDVLQLYNMGPALGKLQVTMAGMMSSRNLPLRICVELNDRVTALGFENAETSISHLNLNHNGEYGEMLWQDYLHGYRNTRPILAMINPEFEDLDAYEVFLAECGTEAAELKTDMQWYNCVSQKPLN